MQLETKSTAHIELNSEKLFFRKKCYGRVFARPTYPNHTHGGRPITTCSACRKNFHRAHLFNWNLTSPSLKKRWICSAAAMPALLFASDLCKSKMLSMVWYLVHSNTIFGEILSRTIGHTRRSSKICLCNDVSKGKRQPRTSRLKDL